MSVFNKALLIILYLPIRIISQNLVPNPDFETYKSCPTNIGQTYRLYNWYPPTGGSTDYYNVCNNTLNGEVGVPIHLTGNRPARSGAGYIGLFLGHWPSFHPNKDSYREYITTKLKEPLKIGKTYCVSFYTAIHKRSIYAVDQASVLFHTDSIITDWFYYETINRTPQINNAPGNILKDTVNWMHISQTFIADSAYNYLTIGNFKTYNNTQAQTIRNYEPSDSYLSYYYIEDVSVVEVNNNLDLKDTISFCKESITYEVGNYEYIKWSTGEVGNKIIITNPGTYSVTVYTGCDSIYDTFTIVDGGCFYVPNVFSPNGDGNNDVFFPQGVTYSNTFYMMITNRWGNVVFSTTKANEGWNGTFKDKLCDTGVYFWYIVSDINGKNVSLSGNVTLLR